MFCSLCILACILTILTTPCVRAFPRKTFETRATEELLAQLRSLMKDTNYVEEPLDAYIIPSGDQRKTYVSGFTGSAGTAIVTADAAYMWTDSRYFLQAAQQLSANWTLMREGLPETPSRESWLSNLPSGSSIGVDPTLITHKEWIPLKDRLETTGQKLIPVSTNLIDAIWPDKPAPTRNPIIPLSFTYTGRTVSEKLDAVQTVMKEKNVKYLVVTTLDEIAWFLNLRGSDFPAQPLILSYLIVEESSFIFFVESERITSDVNRHLLQESGVEYSVQPYDDILVVLTELSKNLNGSRVWMAESTNYAITSAIPTASQLIETTPIPLMKSVKNPVELQGMRNAHIKDAAAVCAFFAWLENHITTENITEISAATQLEGYRKLQDNYIGRSFGTISAVGPNAAMPHYQPTESSNVPITTDTVYLCDSGAQFLDGTTDVTRTVHLGTPTQHERECFTRVLKGQLQLTALVFPSKTKGSSLDPFARRFLWDVGLNFGHGTGHGIGAYLNVHEGPQSITAGVSADDPGFEAGMVSSIEPGYYEDYEFGIRIEDIAIVVKAETEHNFNGVEFLTFESITLVPKQQKMIVTEMMTDAEIDILNAYHKKCREVIGNLLEKQNQSEAIEWLYKETEPLMRSGGSRLGSAGNLMIMAIVTIVVTPLC